MISEEQRLFEISTIGDNLRDFRDKGPLELLEKYVLIPMEKGAFEAFKKVDPSDTVQVMETQKLSQIIDQIRATIEQKIQEGNLAKEYLRNQAEEPE